LFSSLPEVVDLIVSKLIWLGKGLKHIPTEFNDGCQITSAKNI